MHQYEIRVLNEDGKPTTITIPVFPARREPEFGALQLFSAGRREHLKKKRELNEKLEEMITRSAARPRRTTTPLHSLLWIAGQYDTYTKAVLVEEFENETQDSLADFIARFAQLSRKDYSDYQARMRELATYSRYARDVHRQMLQLLFNELRTAHPKFAREDLSELKWADREDFLVALDFITRIYKTTTFVIWKTYEKVNWDEYSGVHEEALSKVPRLDPEMLAAVIKNPDQMEHYVRKAIGWNPTIVANNAKSVAERVLSTPMKLLGKN